ncbi:MAG TPA: hypothetical protein VGR69_06345 [Candidatus Rubrimentiphilum sp.]|nr:hypothetical protein [Candidatus Rubrimentiphilum sp.]
MMQLSRAAIAGVVMSGLLSMMVVPAAGLAQKPAEKPGATTKTTTTKTTTTKATTPKTTKTTTKATTPKVTTPRATTPKVARPARSTTTTRTTTHATGHGTVTHTTTHTTTHATTHGMTRHTTTHTTTHVNTKTGVTRSMTVTHTVVKSVSPQVITKVRGESAARIQTIAKTPTRIAHAVIVQPTVLTRLKVKHANLKSVTFITGTVVSRTPTLVMLRTPSGAVVPVTINNITIVRNVLAPGEAVVVPAQLVSNGFVMVPAFTTVDEDNFANQPIVAPCAMNDNDADDVGDGGTFAPAGACQINDGDADDGFVIPALPASFAPPGLFSSAFQPVVASGVVVAQNGSNVVLLTPNFTPLVVNASAAINAGATNGPLTIGRFVTVSGFDVNNSLVATSFM